MAKRHNTEVPGNVLATQANIDRIMQRLAGTIYQADELVLSNPDEAFYIKALRFRAPPEGRGEWLVITTAMKDEVNVVFFVSGDTFVSCLQAVCSKLVHGDVRWKEDQYANE